MRLTLPAHATYNHSRIAGNRKMITKLGKITIFRMAKDAKKGAKDMAVFPLGDRVLIQPIEAEVTTPSGIIIPDSAKKKESKLGKVLAIGPGKVLENGEVHPIGGVKVGDKVLYRQGWDNEIEIGDEKHYLIGENDLLAVIK